MPLNIDFATPRSVFWLLPLISLSAFIACCVLLYMHLELAKEIGAIENDILENHERAESRKVETVVQPTVEYKRRAKTYKEIDDALSYPWASVFSVVEKASSVDGIALLTMSHGQLNGKTTLVVEAKDMSALLLYIKRLDDVSNDSDGWILISYQVQKNSQSTLKAQIESVRLPPS